MNILSQDVINQLIQDTSLELLPVMITSFLEELERRSAAFEESAELWQAEHAPLPLREAAHALKSCSGTFGAELLYERAKALEDALRAELFDSVPELIEALREAVQQTQQRYRAFHDELNQP